MKFELKWDQINTFRYIWTSAQMLRATCSYHVDFKFSKYICVIFFSHQKMWDSIVTAWKMYRVFIFNVFNRIGMDLLQQSNWSAYNTLQWLKKGQIKGIWWRCFQMMFIFAITSQCQLLLPLLWAFCSNAFFSICTFFQRSSHIFYILSVSIWWIQCKNQR